ncbi:MAG: hypothetical protein GY757_06280 [bacterium]|nr:hypothetical protein [bacterium]
MNLQLDDQKIEVFAGARVRDVLMKYSEEVYKNVLSGKQNVVDKYGNHIDLDGAVSNWQQLSVVDSPGEKE